MSNQVPADLERELGSALRTEPPRGSAQRVWKRVVAATPDAEGGGAVTPGDVLTRAGSAQSSGPSPKRIAGAVAVAAALALIVGAALVMMTAPEQSVVPVPSPGLVLLASAERTLDEASTAAGEGEFGTADELLDKYSGEMQDVEDAAEGDDEVAEALDDSVDRHQVKLDEIAAKVPQEARNRGLARAREVHARNAERKAKRAKEKAEKAEMQDSDSGNDAGNGKAGKKGKGSEKGGKGKGTSGTDSEDSVPADPGDQGGGMGTFDPAG